MRGLRTITASLLALTLLPACAARVEKLVRTRAAADFSCPEADIKVTQNGGALRQDAAGCGRNDTYTADCNLFGICKVRSSEELAAREAELDRQQAARQAARDAAPPPSAGPDDDPGDASPGNTAPKPAPKPEREPSLPSNCGFDSDCGAGVKCNSGRCANTEGSKCGFDSDCGGNGAKCNSSKCSTAPDGRCSFASECPGGSCSSGKCKFK